MEWICVSVAWAAGMASALPQAPPPEQKFKMFVREKVRWISDSSLSPMTDLTPIPWVMLRLGMQVKESGETVLETNYLRLIWDGSIHKWTRVSWHCYLVC